MCPFLMADLHLHTVLSPCAEREMTPEAIIEQAQALELDLIAITDHNSAENVAAVQQAAEGTEITVLPGMEVQTREEVHLLCLFDTLAQVQALQDEVYAHLPDRKNDVRAFGEQWVVDAEGQLVCENERLLLVATNLSVEQVVQRTRQLEGLCIPSHVDRPAYSLISQLGFIPPELGLLAVEISQLVTLEKARARFPQLKALTLVANSDAHRTADMVGRNVFKVERACIGELTMALARRDGRESWVDGLQG